MNYQEIQIDFAYKIQQIEDITFTSGYGDHPEARIRGIVKEEERAEFLQKVNGDTPLTIRKQNGQVLFYGFVSEVYFERKKGIYYLNLTARGATAKLDVLKRSRTFFKKGITYQEIVDAVLETYPGASLISHVDFSKKTDFPIIQYQETDWEFLSRIAALFGATMNSLGSYEHPAIEVGYEKKKVKADITVEHVETERDLLTCEKEFYGKSEVFSVIDAKQDEGLVMAAQTVEYPDALNYTWKGFTLEEYYPVGTLLRVNGAELAVTYVEAYLDRGDLRYDYVVRLPEAIKVVYKDNPRLPGANLTGVVKKRNGNTISITLDIDKDDGIDSEREDYFFTYAIESKDFYCMPVEGARVHLYFPTGKEWEAIAVHSLRSTTDGAQRADKTSNPNNRSLSNDTGSGIDLTPDGITMSPDDNKAIRMKLGSDGSVEISGMDLVISGNEIVIGSSEDGSKAANVSISAGETLMLTMMTGDETGLVPVEDHFIASQGVTQVYATNHIYHSTSGPGKPVMPTYDDSELIAQEQAQADANNQQIADTLIQRNREARSKFGKGLLMAALGAALIVATVVTGGAALAVAGAVVIGTGLAVFGAANMQEGMSGHELAMQGDWTTPAENYLKDVIPEPYYSLVENGLIIAGSVMFAVVTGSWAIAGKMVLGAVINTGTELAFDLIPDGKLDKSPMEYLNSFSTNLMVSSLTGPISRIDGCSGPWGNFAKQFGSGFASTTLSGIAGGDLSWEGLAENFFREAISAGVSTRIGFTTEGKNKWLVAGVDTLTDTFIDSGMQLWDIALGRQEGFDWKRCAQTAVSSLVTNFIFACDPVNCSRGNLLIFKEDLTFATLYGLEKWFRRYDSVLDFEGAFGKGWLHTFESFLFAEPISGGSAEEGLSQDMRDYCIQVMLPDTHKEKFVYRENRWMPEKEGAPYHFRMKAEGGYLLEERAEGKYQAYHYDKKGRLVALQSQPGCAPTRIYYLENGEQIPAFTRSRIDRVEYPGGQSLQFSYKDRLVSSVTDHMGRKVTYHYVDGRLDHVNYPTGGCQEYEYDEGGHITRLKGEDGREFIRNEYDRKGRVIAQHYPDGTSCQMTYVDHERKTIFKYSDSGREEINYYNDKEEILRREYGDGIFETYEYDAYGNKVAETDRNGNTTTYAYDAYGMLIHKCSPEGLETCYAYDDNHQMTEEWDNTGAHKWYVYDSTGCLTEEKELLEEGSYAVTTYTRDEYGRTLTVTDGLGHVTAYAYEENIHKPTEVTTPEGDVYRYAYDPAGRRTKIETDYGTKEITYSETGAVSMETDALGNRTRHQLDAVGNVLKTIRPNQYDEETDNGEGTYYEYDYLDRQILAKYPDGSRKEALLDMDGNLLWENLTAVAPGEVESRATRYTYDGRQYRIMEEAPDGGITYFDRDKNGNLLKTIRPEEYALKGKSGEGITYTYDGENRLTGILDVEGKPFRRFTYDKKGRLMESFEGEAAYGTRYEYDLAGRLLKKWVPVREVSATSDSMTGESTGTVLYNLTCYAYDAAGNRILERRSGEEVKMGSMPVHFLDIRMHYDKQNRLIRVEDSLGAAVEYTYDCLSNRLTEKYRINEDTNRIISYKYDAVGRLTERMESVDLSDVGEAPKAYRKKEFLRTVYDYDKNGNIIKITLPKGGEILREYDLLDRVVSETVKDAASGMDRTTQFAYDAAGRPVSRTNEDGSVSTYTYDICGRLLSETNEEGGTTRYFHNRNGLLTKVVDADNYDAAIDDGAGYTFTYDAFGRIKEVRDAYGQLCEGSEYDSAGRLKKQYDSVGLLVENRYDLGGRTAAIYDTDGTAPVQTYTYDSMGNITGITDGEQNHTDFELDAWGRILTLKAPDGSVETYTYDCAGNITSTTDGNGNTIRYAYNSMQKLGSVTDQAGEADTFTYDGEGNLTVHTDRNGHKVTSTYGSFGLLLSENAEDGTFNHRKYDNRGRLVENASNHVVYRYDYTQSGKVRTKYVNGKPALTYRYTKGGKVAGITDISGKTTEYAYDLNGNLASVTEAGKVLVTYEYDEIGRIANICFANGVKTAYQYDAERNMASITTTGNDGSTLLSYSYRYDRNGNRVEKKDNAGNNHTAYVYDNMQRLCEVSYPEAGKETYTYDAVGNRIRKQTESYTEGYTYDERNRLVQKQLWENGSTTPTDTTTYTYDAQGSLLSEQGTQLCKKYLYNDFHQCICTEVIRGREEEAERILQENRYDGDGLRFSLIENGKRTDFLTNGWDNLAELDESGQVTKRIIRGMGIVASEDAEVSSNATEATGNIVDATSAFAGTSAYHYYHGNERMDVEYITDEAGKVVNGYTYDAFGTIITSSEKLQNRYTYNGEAFDKTTEQYYLRKRFYNPKLSRFIQEDEYRGDGLNLYAFCANNPVMYVDPSGYAGVTYDNRDIYIDGKKIGTVKYKTGEYLDIQINRKLLPQNATTSGIDINNQTINDIYKAFREKNGLIRGKNIEDIIANAVAQQYLQIGDGLDGKFPVIDLGNLSEVISVKSLNEFCSSYRNANGDVDINAVCDQLMTYYNQIDNIDITVNGESVDKTLLAAINGKNKQELVDAIQTEMDKRIKTKHGDDGDDGTKKTKCMVI